MLEYSLLVGGRAGDGIRQVGSLVARLLARLGYRIYFWDDYPSLIRGGHNFSIIRASERKVEAYTDQVNSIVALDPSVVQKHRRKLSPQGILIYDSDLFSTEGLGIPCQSILKEFGGKPVMRNVVCFGALARAMGMDWSLVEEVISAEIKREKEINLKVAKAGFEKAEQSKSIIPKCRDRTFPLLQGNEAIALGALRAGMKIYIAYPMTPSSSILHFLASVEEEFGIITYHPENEIAAVITAIGAAYAGARTMVGTSGGGFCLMTEGVSLCGQSETPVVFVVSQRPGPSTGVPTYTMQSDLHFVLRAGHGEFARLVTAPGDPEQAFILTGFAMNMAWKYQIPTFVLSDKNLSESTYSFTLRGDEVEPGEFSKWAGKGTYRRYEETENGVSPLTFPGDPRSVVKSTSYEHDQYGITTEIASQISFMQEKRLRKRSWIEKEVEDFEAVQVYGNRDSSVALIAWGSTKGTCMEVAEEMGIKLIQPLVLEPFPTRQVQQALSGVERIIGVELNATGELCDLLACYGITVDHRILKYDGRPFSIEELRKRLKEVV
ncbi:MAG: 2-oxoacid:acceptor oxidoreductase subunit alpha [bacterium]